jgi:nitrite reductase/ring-hydroxylating ferredoxin subunit/uncharacterized membrane protein
MMPLKEILEGRPLRTPLHPALVHLPIALLPLSVVFDVASWIFRRPELMLVPGAFLCIVAGLATGLIAAVFGVVDYIGIRNDHPAKRTATWHMLLNILALGLFAAGAGLRYGELSDVQTSGTSLIVSVVGLLVLGYSGYLGGILVYDDGVGVGRHRRRTRTPESTLTVRGSETTLAVAEDSAVREGETLRVDVNGTLVVITRIAGGLHAFQEFCTHRQGPLSEGAFRGCEVICPWHRSHFDIRTGKATQGPATVDLRVFRVESRNGKIWVDVPPPGS